MTQIQSRVWKLIDHSPSIRLELARGIINMRALAKHLQGELGLSGSLDAIISAVRRYEEELPYQATREKAYKVVKGARLSSKNHLASITIEHTADVVCVLPKIFDKVGFTERGTLRIVHTNNAIKIVLDEENLQKAITLFEKKHVKSVQHGMGEVVMDLKPSAWGTPGVLAFLTAELTLNNINILEILTCIPEIIFIFKEDSLMSAYDVLYRVSQGNNFI